MTNNDCMKANQAMTKGKPTGIVVHSTGCNNPYLKRYVQPSTTHSKYSELMKKLGKNLYNNDWNRSGIRSAQHAFIGKQADNSVATYQTLPFTICCWGCGKGSKGSYNYNPTAKIQFEICEDSLYDKVYFNKAFTEAIEFCAYLCKKYGLPVSSITSHKEAHALGYASNHGDPENWLSKYGKDMNWFRAEVQKLLDGDKVDDLPEEKPKEYLVKLKKPIKSGVYTIVEETPDGQYGKLKSGVAWVKLSECEEVDKNG